MEDYNVFATLHYISLCLINVNLRLMEATQLSFFSGGWRWGWCGMYSHFHVQPNYSVEVMLCCVVVGVVTITFLSQLERGYRFFGKEGRGSFEAPLEIND